MDFMNREPDMKVIYREIDDVQLPMWIFYPNEGLKEKNKTVISIHGGSWEAIKDEKLWNGGWMLSNAKYYAEQGYVSIVISYRSMYLKESLTLNDLIDDCQEAIKYIKNNLDFVDSDNVILIGDSAGGHLATMLGVSQDDFVRPNIVIACNPVLDCSKEKIEHILKKEPGDLALCSPMMQNPEKCAKFLFVHGDNDIVVDKNITIEFHKKLKSLGHTSEIELIPGGQHAFILFNYVNDNHYVLDIVKMIDKYIEKFLGR